MHGRKTDRAPPPPLALALTPVLVLMLVLVPVIPAVRRSPLLTEQRPSPADFRPRLAKMDTARGFAFPSPAKDHAPINSSRSK